MKLISILTLMTIVVATTTARKIVIKSNPNKNADLFSEKDFTFSQDKDDNKKPSTFTGDVMKSKTVISENVNKNQNFKFALGTQNGIEIEQVGRLKADGKTLVVQGSYSYTGADGRRYRVRYTADELGYHPITELEIDIPDINVVTVKPVPIKPYTRTARITTTTTTPKPTISPFSKSVFPNQRYLPPSNDYLPPSNEYLPPGDDTRDLIAPYNNVV